MIGCRKNHTKCTITSNPMVPLHIVIRDARTYIVYLFTVICTRLKSRLEWRKTNNEDDDDDHYNNNKDSRIRFADDDCVLNFDTGCTSCHCAQPDRLAFEIHGHVPPLNLDDIASLAQNYHDVHDEYKTHTCADAVIKCYWWELREGGCRRNRRKGST